MYVVYILRSVDHPDHLYIGLTTDLEQRLKSHNANISTYSKRYSPWELEVSINLKNKKTAEDLERYLKTGSGFAFLKKHLLPSKRNLAEVGVVTMGSVRGSSLVSPFL